jgi:cobalt-zinc-cadmium efflux system membrane fusion protein
MGHPKTPRQGLALILALAVWAGHAHAAPPKASGCLIEPEQTVDIGTPVTGVIEEMPVKLGDEVRAGQALVVLRADVEKANAQAAQMRSNVDAEARAAQANLSLAQQKVERSRQLLAQQFVSPQALEQAQAEADVARQKHRLAVAQQQIYRQEQNVAKAQVGLRTLRSPISGIVVERFNNLGERVEEKPVMRVASIDPLKVTLMVPMAQYGQVKEGDTLSIQPELPGQAAVRAQVQYVDKVVDAASNTFRVRLRLPNPEHKLPGGLRCKTDLNTKVALRAAPAPTVPVAQPVASAMKLSQGLSLQAIHREAPAKPINQPSPQLQAAKPSATTTTITTTTPTLPKLAKLPPAPAVQHSPMATQQPSGSRPDKPFKLVTASNF